MSFKSGKTGQHLRAQALEAGKQERMRALQALSHQYGTGSRAILAEVLLATLGGESADNSEGDSVALNGVISTDDIRFVAMGQVADSMHDSANDAEHQNQEAV